MYTSLSMLKDMQLSCDSTVQILDDVLIFDGLRENSPRGAKQRSVIGVNGLFRRLVRDLTPLVCHYNHQDNPSFSLVTQKDNFVARLSYFWIYFHFSVFISPVSKCFYVEFRICATSPSPLVLPMCAVI